MVLPDTYERQMMWWKSHQEAAGMKAEKRERELTKGLSFRPRLAASPQQMRAKPMPQSPRGEKQASLHIVRQEAARSRKPQTNSRSSPSHAKIPHSRVDLTISPPPPPSSGHSPVRRTHSRETRSIPGYSAPKASSAQQPPNSPGSINMTPRSDTDSKKRPKPTWNPASGGGRKAVPPSLSSRGRVGGDLMSPTGTRQTRVNAWEDSTRNNRVGLAGVGGGKAGRQAVMATLGADELEDEEEEELKFYEQLQREKREWQRERAQLLTVIELQQRELGKRANSVQERAAEIAREFAKSVLNFEERLVALETGMQSDVKEVRSMVSKILATTAGETDTDTSSLAHGYNSGPAVATTSTAGNGTSQPQASTSAPSSYGGYKKGGGHS